MAAWRGTVENLVNIAFWQGRRVFITGHTGFKGGWLSLWLQSLGADVAGFALPPPTTPSLFDAARIGTGMQSTIGDIRDGVALASAIARHRPQVLFHLAAQPLVGEGYRDPAGTYATNVMGTLHVLEAARGLPELEAVVLVSTDKCYENREWPWPYRENDTLGGLDPYSSSKACGEILAASYRRSFFATPGAARIATARAGNVIGGGDWAAHRLVPDLLRAFAERRSAQLRHPEAVRPWQHVLLPLSGYLRLAERLVADAGFAGAWNFAPDPADASTVGAIADRLAALWPEGGHWHREAGDFPHEAGQLRLDASLARQRLGWRPAWNLDEALARTVAWQRAWHDGDDMGAFTLQQIQDYSDAGQ